jgi:hypothetical protein
VLPDPQRQNTDLQDRCDSIAELFGLPAEQWRESRDTRSAAPQRSSRFQAVVAWLWEFLVEGFARYGLAMYPCFADPSELSDLLGLPLPAVGEPETELRAEPSSSEFEAPERDFPQVAGQRWHAPRVSGYRGQSATESGTAWP